MFLCASTLVCLSARASVFSYSGVLGCLCSHTLVRPCSRTLVCLGAYVPIRPCVRVLVLWCAWVPMFPYARASVFSYSGMPGCLCSHTPVRPCSRTLVCLGARGLVCPWTLAYGRTYARVSVRLGAGVPVQLGVCMVERRGVRVPVRPYDGVLGYRGAGVPRGVQSAAAVLVPLTWAIAPVIWSSREARVSSCMEWTIWSARLST